MKYHKYGYVCLILFLVAGSLHAGEADGVEWQIPLSAYKPMYFIAGDGPNNIKFQLSMKYRFAQPESFAEGSYWSWLANIYFGYSQLALWDWDSPSQPFHDVNFNPEFFYRTRLMSPSFMPDGSLLSVQYGLEHESNGRDGSDSRSWNRVYIQPRFIFGDRAGYHAEFIPKVWAIVEDNQNDDIAEYLGYTALQLKYGSLRGFMLDCTGRIGTSGKGSIEANLSYPLNKPRNARYSVCLLLQGFSGYGETLLDYNEKEEHIRLGLLVIR